MELIEREIGKFYFPGNTIVDNNNIFIPETICKINFNYYLSGISVIIFSTGLWGHGNRWIPLNKKL